MTTAPPRPRPRPVPAVLAVVLTTVLVVAGAACAAPAGPVLPDGPLPPATVTPYVDVTTGSPPDLRRVGDVTGHRDFVLAFALATGGSCAPSWGGTLPLGLPAIAAAAAAVRAGGGHVTASSGGATGTYLENACPTPEALAGAYGAVLDAVGASTLDVDLEADTPTDRVAAALALVQRTRGTAISLTLPVTDARTVLGSRAMALLGAVAALGVAVRVDVMAMNFPYVGGWADAMTTVAESAARRLAEVWPAADPAALRRRVGLTLMIGRNDQGMVTTLRDAAVVSAAVSARGFGSIGMWSVARDEPCPDEAAARADCSGLAQDPLAFLRTLRAPAGGDPPEGWR